MDRETLRTKCIEKIDKLIGRLGRWMSPEDTDLLRAERKTYVEDDGTVLDRILANWKK